MRPLADEDLDEVIEGRYGRGAMILTTNRDFTEWAELFDNPVLASAALDRLALSRSSREKSGCTPVKRGR